MELRSKDADIASIFDKGLQAHNAGDLIAAEQLYHETLAIQPSHCEANHNIGLVLTARNKLEKALKFFKYALDSGPNVSLFWASYIDTLIKLERISESKTLVKAVKDAGISCEKIEAISQRLNVEYRDPSPKHSQEFAELIEQQNFDDAIQACLNLMDTYPSSAILNINLGKCYFELGQIEPAIKYYEKAVEYQPDWAASFILLGQLYSSQKNSQQAVECLKRAIDLQPDDPELYSALGAELIQNNEPTEAIQYLEKAIKIKPQNATTHFNMGNALQANHSFEAAVKSYYVAIKIQPKNADNYLNMGNALHAQGDLLAAIKSFKQAIKFNPQDATPYSNIGDVLQADHDFHAAIKNYQQAIELKPDYDRAYINMGLALSSKGELDAAIASFTKALEIKPSYDAYVNIGNALQAQGNPLAAVNNLKQAIQIRPDDILAYNNIEFPLKIIKSWPVFTETQLSSLAVPKSSLYAQIAKATLDYNLNLGGSLAQENLNNVLKLLSSYDNVSIQNPKPTSGEPQEKPLTPKNIMALVHFGRSGTGLVHSLIDNHPEVSTLPSYYFSEFFDPSNWEKLLAGGWGNVVDQFIKTYAVLFDASSAFPTRKGTDFQSPGGAFIDKMGMREGFTTLGQNQGQVFKVNKKIFQKELIRLMDLYNELDTFTFFKLVHYAYETAQNRGTIKKHIFYHIHNPRTYAQLNFLRSAPNTKWIVMVREPIQSCESWLNYHFQQNDFATVTNMIVQMLFEIDNVIYKNKNSIGVRLEDLKHCPRKTIPALCVWMGISETEGLYQMTAQGKRWWGDPTSQDYSKDGMNAFGTVAIRRKIGTVFSANDQFILRTLFYPFSARFGYVEDNTEQFKVDLQTIKPQLDTMFDFEKVMANNKGVKAEQFMKSGSFLYFRASMAERWNTLNSNGTYNSMVRPLKIKR